MSFPLSKTFVKLRHLPKSLIILESKLFISILSVDYLFHERENYPILISELIKKNEEVPETMGYIGSFKDYQGILGVDGNYSHHFVLENGAVIVGSREGGLIQLCVKDEVHQDDTILLLSNLSKINREKFIIAR